MYLHSLNILSGEPSCEHAQINTLQIILNARSPALRATLSTAITLTWSFFLFYVCVHACKCMYIISFHIISYHCMTHHIKSYHIISYNSMTYHIRSYHVVPYNSISLTYIADPSGSQGFWSQFKVISQESEIN